MRLVAVYLSLKLGEHKQGESGKTVRLEKTSSVSSAYLRIKARMADDRKLAAQRARN